MCVIFSKKKNTQQLYIIVNSFHLYKTAVWSRHCWRWRHSRSPYPLERTSVRRLRCANGCGCVQVTMNCGWGRGRGRVEVVFNSTQKSNRIEIGKNLVAECRKQAQQRTSLDVRTALTFEASCPEQALSWMTSLCREQFFLLIWSLACRKNSKLRLKIEQDSDVR